MPTDCLNVPHYRQETEASCVAACVRMILAYYGHQETEESLRHLLSTSFRGTAARYVRRVAALGFDVHLSTHSMAELRQYLHRNIPALIFLHVGPLSYYPGDGPHAVVAVGITDEEVWINDPDWEVAPQQVSRLEFALAWSKTDYLMAAICPREESAP